MLYYAIADIVFSQEVGIEKNNSARLLFFFIIYYMISNIIFLQKYERKNFFFNNITLQTLFFAKNRERKYNSRQLLFFSSVLYDYGCYFPQRQ